MAERHKTYNEVTELTTQARAFHRPARRDALTASLARRLHR